MKPASLITLVYGTLVSGQGKVFLLDDVFEF